MLSKYGLADSAFGARMLAEETGQQNQRVAEVPANTAEEMISGVPSTVGAAEGAGAELLGKAGGLNINRKMSSSRSDWNVQLKDLMDLLAAA
jgi:hypothetical protein